MLLRFREFAQHIENNYPKLRVTIEEFPSTNIWLSIYGLSQDKDIEFLYRRDKGFGVSLNDENTLPFTGPDQVFDNFDEARDQVLLLIQRYVSNQ